MEKLFVRSSALEKLEHLAGRPPASIHLVAKEYDHPGLGALAAALREHGAANAVRIWVAARDREPLRRWKRTLPKHAARATSTGDSLTDGDRR